MKWFTLLLLLFFTSNTTAQLTGYQLQLFDYTTGIKPGDIKEIQKDGKGFLWILYPHSVQRFDGKDIVTFKVSGELTHLYCDSKNRLWVTAFDNIWLFKEEAHDFAKVAVHINTDTFYTGQVFQLKGNDVYLNTTQGFCIYNEAKQLFIPSPFTVPLLHPYSVRSFNYCGATLFIKHKNFIYAYNTASKKLDSLPETETNRIYPVSEDSAMVTTWQNKSYWYNFSSRRITPVILSALSAGTTNSFFTLRSVVQYLPYQFLIASREGIFNYDSRTNQYKKLSLFLHGSPVITNDFASDIYADKDGYAWLATTDGIARFSIQHQTIGLIRITQLADNALPGVNNVRKIIEDNESNLWIATAEGIACWKQAENKWLFFPPVQGAADRLAQPSVRGMVYDGKYLILGPTNLGLWLFNPKTYQFRRPVFENTDEGNRTKTLSDGDFVDDILTLKNGNHVIMGRDELYVMDGTTYTVRTVKTPASEENTNYAFQDKKGIVWLTTDKGLHCLDSNLNYLQKVALPFKNIFITGGCLLHDNRFAFSVESGLYTALYNNGKITVTKFTDAFDHVLLSSVYEDKNNMLWASSENGIYRFNLATSETTLFDYYDNVQSYSFNAHNAYVSKNGLLYFGGTNGINYLQPRTLTNTNEKLNVFIEQINLGGKSSYYVLPHNPVLNYSQRALVVQFNAPYFNNPDNVNYRYKLEGNENAWKYIGNDRYLHFTSLPSGKYTLRLQASVNNMNWIEAGNSFTFTIDTPYWQKWWFILACAVVTAGSIYWFVKHRNRVIQEQLETENIINHFASSMYEQEKVEPILWDVVKNCIGRLHFEDCVIYLADEKRNVLVQKAAYGPKGTDENSVQNPIEIPVGKGITGSVAASGRAEIIGNTTLDSRYIVDNRPNLSEIAVPIMSGTKVLGVIDCEHSKSNFFKQKHLSVLTTVASLCANKIIKAQAEQERQKALIELMDAQRKMGEVEMQALRAQMNPHFIFNCLNSINRYIVKSDQATASLYLTKFAKLIRLILDNSNSQKVVLANELEALKIYIDMEALRFDKKFTYKITVNGDICADTIEVPPLIIQPYVENAIWHGLLHKDGGGHLAIHITMPQPAILECIIEDNGVGRAKAKELKSKSAVTRKSLGMKLTEHRLALLNKQAEMNANIDIIDLNDGQNEPSGTKVIITIPI